MNLDVHLIQSFLHPLNAPRTFFDKVPQLPLKRSEPSNRLTRTKRSAKKTATMEQLQPLAIADVGFAARDIVELSGIDQKNSDSPRFQQLIDRNPVDVGAFHGHRFHA